MLWKIVSRVSGRGWLNRCFCRRWNREIRRMSLRRRYKCSIGTPLLSQKKTITWVSAQRKINCFFSIFPCGNDAASNKKKKTSKQKLFLLLLFHWNNVNALKRASRRFHFSFFAEMLFNCPYGERFFATPWKINFFLSRKPCCIQLWKKDKHGKARAFPQCLHINSPWKAVLWTSAGMSTCRHSDRMVKERGAHWKTKMPSEFNCAYGGVLM